VRLRHLAREAVGTSSLRLEEERHFLAPFFTRAQTGEIATVAEIQRAFEVQVGHEVDDSTIYRLLARHGWRQLMPRPTHPKASKEAQEQFKKTLRAPRSGGSRNTSRRR
jgi:transposase